MTDCIVLVTGGAGFLGQHVVGLLQSRALHVSEIRVIDVMPYENKLDYVSTKPVKQYVGSITDRDLVRRACDGVSTVMHIASIIDVTMFPDMDKMERINVQGTAVLLDVCKEVGVRRFLYCSSMSVISGFDDIINGTEETTSIPKRFINRGYGETKQKAESLVLSFNSDELRTIAIRPLPIYGEEGFISAEPLRIAKKTGRWTRFNCKGVTQEMTYVGNVAWAFICAEKAMMNDDANTIGGNVFFATDDTPQGEMVELLEPFAKACNFSVDGFKIPLWVFIYFAYIVYFILLLISPVVKLNVPFSVDNFKQMGVSFSFTSDKAKRMLGYAPLYNYEESFKRSMTFYKQYTR